MTVWNSGRHSKVRELSDNATRRRGIPPFLRPPPQHLRSLTYWRFAIGSYRRRADALEILPPRERDGHRGRVHEKQRKETERPRLATHVRAPFRNGAGILLSLGRHTPRVASIRSFHLSAAHDTRMIIISRPLSSLPLSTTAAARPDSQRQIMTFQTQTGTQPDKHTLWERCRHALAPPRVS